MKIALQEKGRRLVRVLHFTRSRTRHCRPREVQVFPSLFPHEVAPCL